MVHNNLITKYKFYVISLASFALPYVEFINFNSGALEPFLFKTLAYTVIFFIFFSFVLSLILFFFLHKKFIEIFYFFALTIFIFFNYDKIKTIVHLFYGNPSFLFGGELSVILIFILVIILFFIFLTKRNAWLLNFFNIYIIILFAFNLFNFFYLHKNLNQLKYPTVYSNEIYFTDNEVVNILKNENNKNIYYIVMDSAIPLNIYSEQFKEIDVNKIITDFKKKDFIYIDDVNSSYDHTHLTLSQILNLNYFIDESSPSYNFSTIYPTIMSKFETTPLGKTLEKINYDSFWVGNAMYNCAYYNISLCLPNRINTKNYFESLIPNIRNLIYTNYVLTNFLQKTPIIDFNNKVFLSIKTKHSSRETAFFENDGIKKFMQFSNNLKKSKKNYFVFIHAFMTHSFAVPKDIPLIYEKDCSMRMVSKKMAVELTKYIYDDADEQKIGYETNYLCMLKRLNEFVKFINIFDSKAIVFIQADHGIDLEGVSRNKIFSLAKVTPECEKYLTNQIDNINAIRLSLSCATSQPVKLLKQKSFKESNVPAGHKDWNKVWLIK